MDNQDNDNSDGNSPSTPPINTGDIYKVGAMIILAFIALIVFVVAAGLMGELTGVQVKNTATTGSPTGNPSGAPSKTGKCDATAQLMAMYGSSASEVRAQLVPINFMGKTVQVHKKAAPYFQAVVNDIKASGTTYKFRRLGTFNWRSNRNNSSQLSTHSFGIAIDINDDVNCNGCTKSDFPDVVINAFRNNGFRWGGDYHGKKDPMHFEFLGLCPGDSSE